MLRALVVGLFGCLAPVVSGDIVITEWMYNGAGSGSKGEFVEFTNVGPDAIDMTGWSFDDDSRIPGTISLSAFGVVAPGESAILTDETAEDFAAIWGLSGVKIIGGNTANLGRNDEINLYDAGANLVDRLTYGDEAFPGTVRTANQSCNIPATDYGYVVVQPSWVLATDGDSYGSKVSTRGEVGSPGRIVGYARVDFDRDGDVDLDDFDVFDGCFAGPLVAYEPPPPGCLLSPDDSGFLAADTDEDGDVDMADFSTFQLCYSGADNPADPACGQPTEPPGETEIILNGTYITVIGSGVNVEGTRATIIAGGTYNVTGSLIDGQLVVSAPGGLVRLVLKGVEIANSSNAPLFVLSAAQTEIVLAAQTANVLYDAHTYVYEDPEQDEPNACLFSKDSLTISGTGSLTVYGNYNDAIASKDELVIAGGTIHAIAVDDGIRGKDYLLIQDGDITVTAGGDGLKSDNSADPALGYVAVENGFVYITSGGDGIAAETSVFVTAGDVTVTAGGGHSATLPPDLSAKGIKGLASVVIDGGTFNLDGADDGIHSNDAVTINGGTFIIASGDDAVHADFDLEIHGGTIVITTCFEGLEGANITITDGQFDIVSDDDAITADIGVFIGGGDFSILSGGGHNVTIPSSASAKAIKGLVSVVIEGGTFDIDAADDGLHSNGSIAVSGGILTIATNSSVSASYGDGIHADNIVQISGGTITMTICYEGIEGRDITIDAGTIHITSTDDGINAAGGSGLNNYMRFNGGYVAVYAAGDGLDANGYIIMTGGTVLVHGPIIDYESPIDYDGTFKITGGLLVAAGSAGMAQAPSNISTQRSVKITYSSWKTAGTLVHIETAATPHVDVLTFAPSKQYRSVVFSSPALTQGTSFDLYRGGSCNGTVVDGLYLDGTYTPGTKTNTFTTTNIVTNVSAP